MHLKLAALALAFCAALPAQITITNASSGRVVPGVAPGSFASAYGDFRGVAATSASSVPFTPSLAGVTVTIGGTSAPLQYAGPNQINFLVPNATTPGVHEVVITTGGGRLTGTARVVPVAPGIGVQDTATPPKGAILNQDSTLNAQSNPARPGDVIQIFGTGAGRVSGQVDDGAPAPSSPLAATSSRPQVFVGGVEATVQFSGLAPNLVGTWQVNAVVPNQPFLSGRVPLVVFLDGVDSNEVTVFVAQ